MTYKIEMHRLVGDNVEQVDCQGKDSGLFTAGLPDTLVIHFTAGSSLESSVKHLSDPDVKASAHLVVGRSGETTQLIGFDRVAWHAGISEWRGRKGLNRYSIGIELDNAGKMTKSGQAFVSWFGRKYDADQVIEAVHRNESSPSYWHTYSEEQLTSCFDLCRCLTRTYPIKTIVGHEEIAPGRKIDPGPAFPLERLREQILIGRSRDIAEEVEQPETPDTSTKAVVNTQLLNIRELPYSGSNLAGSPLPKGTIVEILERSDKWCKVKTVTQGWVHGDFLRVEG